MTDDDAWTSAACTRLRMYDAYDKLVKAVVKLTLENPAAGERIADEATDAVLRLVDLAEDERTRPAKPQASPPAESCGTILER